MKLSILPLNQSHFSSWSQLYAKYGLFYEVEIDSSHQEFIWKAILDPSEHFYGLGAFLGETLVGFAHYRLFLHSLKGGYSLFLDDLFVDSTLRKQGIGRKILESILSIGKEKNYKCVRWITAPTNASAKNLYDQYAKLTPWQTYDCMIENI